MDIFLARHTQYQNPDHITPLHLPLPLSEEGVAHAHKIGEYLVGKDIQSIFTSPIKRAVQTAETINQHLHVSITQNPLFVEVTNPNLQGQPRGPYNQCVYTHPGGETLEDIKTRMLTGLNQVMQTNQTSLIVSHGDPITILYCALTNQQVPHAPNSPDGCYIKKGELIRLCYENQKLTNWELHTVKS